MQKWFLGPGHKKKKKKNLEHLIVPENKKVIKKKNKDGYIKATLEPTERVPNGQSGIMLYSTTYPRYTILYEKMRQNRIIVEK